MFFVWYLGQQKEDKDVWVLDSFRWSYSKKLKRRAVSTLDFQGDFDSFASIYPGRFLSGWPIEWLNEWMNEMNEVKWNEVKWNDMKWSEMKWNEWSEMKWNEMKWNEMKWMNEWMNECTKHLIHAPLRLHNLHVFVRVYWNIFIYTVISNSCEIIWNLFDYTYDS